MKYLTLAILAALIIISGCSKDAPLALEQQESYNVLDVQTQDNEVQCKKHKPYRRLPIIAKYTATTETIKPPDFANGDYILEIEANGVGHSTLLGPSKMYFYEYINLGVSPSEMSSDNISLSSIRTGDKIEGSLTGIAFPVNETDVTFEGTFYIEGGTGKFVGAKGEVEFKGEATTDLATGAGSGWVKFKGHVLINKHPLS